MSRSRIVGLGIFVIALVVRLYQIDGIPPGVQGDELFNLIDANQIRWGNLPLFFEGNNGREPLYFYLLHLSMTLFGESIWAMRLPSAVLGSGSAWVAWAIGRERFNWRVGLVAAGLIALSLWPVMHGRLALRAVSLTFFGGLAILLWGRLLYGEQHCTVEAQRRQRFEGKVGNLIGAGIALGLVLYTYIPGRIFALIIVAWVVWMVLFERARVLERWRPILIAFGVAFVVMLPLLWFAFTYPDLFNQRIESSGPQQWRRGIPAVLGMFSVRGDNSWRYWIAGRPLFHPAMSVLFYVGMCVCVWRSFVGKRRGVHLMILAWLVNQVAPSLMLGWHFLALRTAGAVIPVYLITGMGVDMLWGIIHAKMQRRDVLIGGILVMFGLVGWQSWADLQAWAVHPEVRDIYRAAAADMGRYLHDQQSVNSTPRFLGVTYAYDAPTAVGLNLYRPGAYSLYASDTAVPINDDVELIVAADDSLPPFGKWETRPITASNGHLVTISPLELPPFASLDTPNVMFGNGLTLIGMVEAGSDVDSAERGRPLPVQLLFRVDDGVGAPNKLTSLNIDLLDAGGNVRAQHSTLIGYPQASWQLGDQFVQFTAVTIPNGMPPGMARLRFSMSDSDGSPIVGGGDSRPFLVGQNDVFEGYVPAADTLIFDDTIALDNVTMSTLAAPGLSHDLALDWVVIAPITQPVTLTFALVDAEGTAVYTHTTPLSDESWPATAWRENERVTVQYRLNLPLDLTSRENNLVVHLSNLPVTNGDAEISPLTLNIHERLFTLPDVSNRVDYAWEDGIRLRGYGVEQTADTLKLTLVWQTTSVPKNDYTIFNHLIAADGMLADQLDAPPQHPASQTRTWQAGEVIVEERIIPVGDVPAGAYQLFVGMYDRATIERLPLNEGNDGVALTTVNVDVR